MPTRGRGPSNRFKSLDIRSVKLSIGRLSLLLRARLMCFPDTSEFFKSHRGGFIMKGRSYSEASPLISACNNTKLYYIPRVPFPKLSELIGCNLTQESIVNRHIYVLLQVSLLYACRVGELLRSTSRDIIVYDRLYIKAEKNSRDYFLYLPGLVDCFMEPLKKNSPVPIFPFTYLQVYRACQKIGLYQYFEGHENKTVTHLGRFLLASSINGIADEKAAGDILRHRSSRTIQYYLKRRS